MLDRRELLRSVGAGAALAWLGCGGGAAPPPVTAARALEPDALRARLREAVSRLGARFPYASVLAVQRTHLVLAADGGAQGSRREASTSLLIAVRDPGGRAIERVSTVLTAVAIEREVATLEALAVRRAKQRIDPGPPSDAGGGGRAIGDLAPALAGLVARAETAGSSRLVYRGAYVELDDADVLFIGPGCDRRERRVRSRAGVVLAAWRGARLVTEEVSIAGAGVIDADGLGGEAIEDAAVRALEPMTPGEPPSGATEVVLDPGVVAAIAEAGIAEVMTAEAWRRGAAARSGGLVGSALVTVRDDPSAATAAAYGFDDEGRVAAPAVLVEAGRLGAPLADAAGAAVLGVAATAHARRPGGVGAVAARPCHVAVAGGPSRRDAIIAGVDRGLLLEGATSVRVEPASWRVVVRVARGRRLGKGRLTGHVHADLELRSTVPALLASVSAASAETVTRARRDEIEGEPLWRAATAPWWLARGEIVPGRGLDVSGLTSLKAALGSRGAASEWVVEHRRGDSAVVRTGEGPLQREAARSGLAGIVHRDTVTGRGSARLALGDDGAMDAAVDDALARAAGSVGPAWRMAVAAAPAKVAVADDALARGLTLDRAAELASDLAAKVAARGLTAIWSQAEVVRDELTVLTSQGLEVRWRATEARLRALVGDGAQRREIEVWARQRADLDAARAVATAGRRLKAMAVAEATPAGTWSVLLGPDALLAGGDLGMLAAFAAQADAVVERQGLTRYRSGQPVAEGAAAADDPLTLISDGTLAFGPRSAPIADDGEPVRRFTLVDRGIAAGLALDHREAALRGASPNGGVRNLVVSAGRAGRDELMAAPVLELDEVTWLDLDPRSGELSAAIALAIVHDARGSRPVSGGVMRIDAIAALALARRSQAIIRRGAYAGPAQWRITAEIS